MQSDTQSNNEKTEMIVFFAKTKKTNCAHTDINERSYTCTFSILYHFFLALFIFGACDDDLLFCHKALSLSGWSQISFSAHENQAIALFLFYFLRMTMCSTTTNDYNILFCLFFPLFAIPFSSRPTPRIYDLFFLAISAMYLFLCTCLILIFFPLYIHTGTHTHRPTITKNTRSTHPHALSAMDWWHCVHQRREKCEQRQEQQQRRMKKSVYWREKSEKYNIQKKELTKATKIGDTTTALTEGEKTCQKHFFKRRKSIDFLF